MTEYLTESVGASYSAIVRSFSPNCANILSIGLLPSHKGEAKCIITIICQILAVLAVLGSERPSALRSSRKKTIFVSSMGVGASWNAIHVHLLTPVSLQIKYGYLYRRGPQVDYSSCHGPMINSHLHSVWLERFLPLLKWR